MPKLVEVALPLAELSEACRRDKDRKVGTIRNVHKWFAPMPTPAWRALLFASLVDDPGDEGMRKELLDLIVRLCPADGPPTADALAEAHARIVEACGGDLPVVFDPFCGGGSTLVEAQRLGLPTFGSDLNPVPVLITKVLTELVPSVAGRSPLVGDPAQLGRLSGGPLDGLLADVRHYAERVRAEVWEQVGHLYPTPPGGGTVVAWLWARTVTCSNQTCRATAPLVSSFWLSKRKGAHTWVDYDVLPDRSGVRFTVRTGGGEPRTGTVERTNATCLVCGMPMPLQHVRDEGSTGRLGSQLLAVAVDRGGSRLYVSPDDAGDVPAPSRPADAPSVPVERHGLSIRVPLYGMTTQADLYTNRQLVMLGAFADTVAKVADWVRVDGGDDRYATTVASILGLAVGKLAMGHSTQARVETPLNSSTRIHPAFGRHALPMVWDFAEVNAFAADAPANWIDAVGSMSSAFGSLPVARPGSVASADARAAGRLLDRPALVATDPPYFAHIGYADLSDYFYVWHRRALGGVHPDLYRTVATPKTEELIAAPYRHGGIKQATRYFVDGFTETFTSLRAASHPDLPMLVIYAHRQEESDGEGTSATAWDAMLTAILNAGLRIVGTWPLWATTSNRQIGQGTNAMASYVVLVCRPAQVGARTVDRQRFLSDLRVELPRAIRTLKERAISAVDLGQATIGPGMAVFCRYGKVVEPDGGTMDVAEAQRVINRVRSEVLHNFAEDIDRDTLWAMEWFKDHGYEWGSYDEAEKAMKTANTSLEGLRAAGIVESGASRVRLLRPNELPAGWDPVADQRLTVWEVLGHLLQAHGDGGNEAAADLMALVPEFGADAARELAYWLFDETHQTRAKDAVPFNALTSEWTEIARLADDRPGQQRLAY